MADIKKFLPYLQIEGEYSNDPDDSGGPTMIGVTLATLTEYCKIKGLPKPTIADLKNISPDMWEDVVKIMFWNKWRADNIINQSVANILVDWFFNSGYWGIKIPQRILGLKEDGIVGIKTLYAINNANQESLFYQIYKARFDYYADLVVSRPKDKKFINGWNNRLSEFSFEA